MPIVIQELVASDSISQAVDKINFNFDQLILNGGGPPGPAGPIGPTGPVGGRGIKGATWYRDNTPQPGTNPNSIIISGLADGDFYLQSNGQVWEYITNIWVDTTINLTGPQGTPGSSIGFNYAGGFPGTASINNQNVAYAVPMPGGVGSGASQATNQGISTVLLGGVASNAIAPAGITFDSSFQIPDAITKTTDSSLVSVLVHQKNSSSAAIKFMGGGVDLDDKYEQAQLANLSNISLGIDDAININVPKSATTPQFISDLIGLNINTFKKGQQYRAGKHINFISGVDTAVSLPSEISDINFTVNTSNPANPGKFTVNILDSIASAVFEVGGRITPSLSTVRTGRVYGDADRIDFVANRARIRTSQFNFIEVSPTNMLVQGGTSPINLTTTNAQAININSAGSVLVSAGSNITLENINPASSAIIKSNRVRLGEASNVHSAFVDNSSVPNGGTKVKGNFTWSANGQINPFVTSHRNISVEKTGLPNTAPAIYIGDTNTGLTAARNLMIAAFKGTTYSTAIEYNRIHTASTEIRNTAGNAGWVGHTVENTSTAMAPGNVGFKLSGVDRDGGDPGVLPKFHAMESITSVYNRMHYARKYLNINPLIEGISLNGNYVIPSTFMDTSFLDIYVGWGGDALPPGLTTSGDDFNIVVPDGIYPGQRLCIHIVAAPCRAYDEEAGSAVSWPAIPVGPLFAAAVSPPGTVTLRTATWQESDLPNNNILVNLEVTYPNANPVKGDEAYIELVWIGQEYIQADQTAFNGPIKQNSAYRGWVAVNGVQAERIGSVAEQNKGSFSTNASMTFT